MNQKVNTVSLILHVSLLTVNTGKIKLSHFSVKEFLLSSHVEEYFSINEKISNSKISRLSIAYLLQFDDDSLALTVATLISMPLALYAAEHWIDHAKSGEMDSTVVQLILCLFTSESAPLKNWIRIYNIDEGGYSDLLMDTSTSKVCSTLYYSSLAGMQEVSDCLLCKGENVNAEGGRLGNALQAASYKGYKGISKLLLENGAEVNAKGGEYGNALQAASFRGGGNVETETSARKWGRSECRGRKIWKCSPSSIIYGC